MPLVVAAAIVAPDQVRRAADIRILAAQRSYPAHLAGQWELPGGKVEPGEEPEQALRRELLEELGVTVELGSEVLFGDAPELGWPILEGLRMRVWLATLTGRALPQPGDSHTAVRWLNPAASAVLPWLPTNLPIAEAAFAQAGAALPSPQI
ncbi:MAG: NUDIX domain-containing protein [Buchananella hordeovulneris]|nr:NUDIX domain-containing protein [Buchananella hordeovulneris]